MIKFKTILMAGYYDPSGVWFTLFPPAPHHTFFGMVRDELGQPLQGDKVEVLFETSSGRLVRTGVGLMVARDQLPFESADGCGRPRPISTTRWRCDHAMPYRIRLKVDGAKCLSADRDDRVTWTRWGNQARKLCSI